MDGIKIKELQQMYFAAAQILEDRIKIRFHRVVGNHPAEVPMRDELKKAGHTQE